MDQTQNNKMGNAPLFRLIMSMSLPAMFSMLVQACYNIVDSVFVAQIGEDALTALSLSFPVQTLLISVAVGTGVGVNSLVSRRLGEKNQEQADKAACNGLMLSIVSWIFFAILGIFFTRPFFESFTENQTVIEMGCSYIYVNLICCFGVTVQIMLEKTLQATGNMIYPMLFQLTGAITNIILDPILIFGWLGMPKMGVLGAAIATVIGQIVALLFSIYVIVRKNHDVAITLKHYRPDWKVIKDIYAVGFPSIIMQSIGSALTVCLNMILIGFTESAVAVLGVYYKLQSFVFMPVFGLTSGIMPIMGYNFGAHNKKRLLSSLKIGSVIAFAIMSAGTALFLLFPKELLTIFNASPKMIEIGVPALRIISLCFIPASIGIIFSTLFQAIGMGSKSLVISLLRQVIIILPLAYLFSKVGLDLVWTAFPIAEVVSCIVSVVIYLAVYKKKLQFLTRA